MNLSTYIQTNSTIPFSWGNHDCITFALGWVHIRTGRDYLAEHRPWSAAREARKKLRDLGGLFFLFDHHLMRINPNMAKDGDLAIYQGAAHLFSGRHIVSVARKKGLVFTDRCIVTEAWTCHS